MPSTDTTADLLVVDDQPANLQLLAGMLKTCGYKVRLAPSGALALQAARHEAPDLFLLDINMPGMSGYEVCEQLKADKALRDIPVLFISALDDVLDKVRAFRVGGVDYIVKPFQFQDVAVRVSTHLAIRRQELLLQRNYARLQELERARDNLAHMIVHDMRSPLATAKLCLEVLNDETPRESERQKRLIATAHRSLAEVIAMTSDLLDISRLESGQMPIARQREDLAALARRVASSLETQFQGRTFEIQAPEACPADCDPEVAARVMVNLLNNAFKFTPDNGKVALSLEREAGGVRVSVEDTGPGIAPEFQPRIFDKFAQSEEGQRHRGSGLGLAFCKLAVEAHGGRIGFNTVPGSGSTFWFTLPDTAGPVAELGSG